MSADRQTMLLHAVPLLVLAGLYGLASILLGVALLRERRATGLGLGIWLLFTLVAAISALLAGLALGGRDVLAGEPSWLIVLSAAAIAVPGLIVLFRGSDRRLLVTARRLRELGIAQEPVAGLDPLETGPRALSAPELLDQLDELGREGRDEVHLARERVPDPPGPSAEASA